MQKELEIVNFIEALNLDDTHIPSKESVSKLLTVLKEEPTLLNYFSLINRSLAIQNDMAKVGFDWDDPSGLFDKTIEELEEVRAAFNSGDKHSLELEIGDLLFTVINLSRFLKVNPNKALILANKKLNNRFTALKKLAHERGITLDTAHVVEMNNLWDEIKEKEEC